MKKTKFWVFSPIAIIPAVPALALISCGSDVDVAAEMEALRISLIEDATTSLPGPTFLAVSLPETTITKTNVESVQTKLGVILPKFSTNVVLKVWKDAEVANVPGSGRSISYKISNALTGDGPKEYQFEVFFNKSTADAAIFQNARTELSKITVSSLAHAAFTALVVAPDSNVTENFDTARIALGITALSFADRNKIQILVTKEAGSDNVTYTLRSILAAAEPFTVKFIFPTIKPGGTPTSPTRQPSSQTGQTH